MIAKFAQFALAAFAMSALCLAQAPDAAASIVIRAVLHDPTGPAVEFFVMGKSGKAEKLNLQQSSLSEPLATIPLNGAVVFYKSAAIDPKKPQEHVVATLKVPDSVKRAIIILLPSGPQANGTYRALLIDDTGNSFPYGESRVLSMIRVEAAIQAGEHKLLVTPGQITKVPLVKKINDFNMAQTNFYYKEGAAWVTFTERQVQYLPEYRRIYIIHATPGATQPYISTIVDIAPAKLPDPS
jgi:hypothetical protein